MRTIFHLFLCLFIFLQFCISHGQTKTKYYFLPKSTFMDYAKESLNRSQKNDLEENRTRFIVWSNNFNNPKTIVPFEILLEDDIYSILNSQSEKYFKENNNVCFLTRDQVTKITIEEILHGKDYSLIELVYDEIKSNERGELDFGKIDFLIIAFEKDTLDIYYHLENTSKLELTNRIINSKCIEFWERWLPVLKNEDQFNSFEAIFIEIYSWIQNKSIKRLTGDFLRFDGDLHPIKIKPPDENIILLKFDVNKEINLLTAQNITNSSYTYPWRIIEKSIFSCIVSKYSNSELIKISSNRTFTFFSLETNSINFEHGMSELTPGIKQSLNSTLQIIEDYSKSPKAGLITITVTGYADKFFRKELGEQQWLIKNNMLAKLRAENVSKWFMMRLQNHLSKVKIENEACEESYFYGNDTYVKIKAFDY
ncbi:MAG: OmpA family protein [Candidatus Lokiarchaeota archaeon]|nr:OmpA family protein [Candidatus Lokiarchaeota archaeon]